jgi:hypothetical protein
MGVVYEAVDGETGERVALKTLRTLSADSLARFKREFRALKDLQHPNVVSLGELFSEGERWFFSMELVEGRDFLAYVRPLATADPHAPTVRVSARAAGQPLFDELRLRAALGQLAEALEAVHAAGLVHRDLKPANVRVTSEGRVSLLDFGLVFDLERRASSTEHVVGSAAYMAPEQAASKRVGPEADWYSVGVMLYEALVGAVPFDGAPLEILLRKQQEQPAPPSAKLASVPADLDELCSALLRIEPDSRPKSGDVLRALGQEERRGSLASASQTQHVPFVGRAAELDALERARADSRERPVVVFLVGESGVGKSCVARRFLERLEDDDQAMVFAGRCNEHEAVPYKALDGVMDDLALRLARDPVLAAAAVPTRAAPLIQAFPVLRRVEAFAMVRTLDVGALSPLEVRGRAFTALRDLFERLAERRSVVLFIDDAQWADADSVALLGAILRQPDAPRLLVIATARPVAQAGPSGDAGEPAWRSTLEGDVRILRIERLAPAEGSELARRILERAAPTRLAQADTIAREAGGHPFFIDALVRYGTGGTTGAERQLEDALWSRIGELSEECGVILSMLAVTGAPVSQDVLSRAAAIDRTAFARAVSFLRVAHLVSVTGGRAADTVEPYHDRVRDAVLVHLDDETKRARHKRLALAFEAAETRDFEALARHWRGAGDAEVAWGYLLRAADQAAGALAFNRAARLYEEALSAREVPEADRRRIETNLGEALANAGRGALAARAFLAAASSAAEGDALDLRRRAAEQLLFSGHFDAGVAEIRAVIGRVGLRFPASRLTALLQVVLWRLLIRIRGYRFKRRDTNPASAFTLQRADVCWSAGKGLGTHDPVIGSFFTLRFLRMSLRMGDAARAARALAVEVVFLSSTEGTKARSRVEGLIRTCRALAGQGTPPDVTGWTIGVEGIADYMFGRFRPGFERCIEAQQIFRERCVGVHFEISTVECFALWSLANLGEFRELAKRQPTYLREAHDRGDRFGVVLYSSNDGALLWLAQDDPDRVHRELDAAMAQWTKAGFHTEHFYELVARTHADLYGGRSAGALRRLELTLPVLKRALLWRSQSVRVKTWHAHARVALAAARAGAAATRDVRRLVLGSARAIEREPIAFTPAVAALLRAGVASLDGRTEECVEELRRAIQQFGACEMRVYAHAARYALGATLGGDEGAKQAEEAVAGLREAGVARPLTMARTLATGFAE